MARTPPPVYPELCDHMEEEGGQGMPSPVSEAREMQMNYVLLPDLTQASPQGGPRLPLTVDLGSTMRLFPPEADIETKIQLQVVYLVVIPEDARRAVGK